MSDSHSYDFIWERALEIEKWPTLYIGIIQYICEPEGRIKYVSETEHKILDKFNQN